MSGSDPDADAGNWMRSRTGGRWESRAEALTLIDGCVRRVEYAGAGSKRSTRLGTEPLVAGATESRTAGRSTDRLASISMGIS